MQSAKDIIEERVQLSQNGWPVLTSEESCVRLKIPDSERSFLLAPGAPAFLLAHWITWFVRNIESLDQQADDWGWSLRRISGSDEWSNHSSGTAVDLNSLKHPQGESQTFFHRKMTKIRDRLTSGVYSNSIRWGGDFRTTPDEMHFEIVQPRMMVREIALQLLWTPIGKAIKEANPNFNFGDSMTETAHLGDSPTTSTTPLESEQ